MLRRAVDGHVNSCRPRNQLAVDVRYMAVALHLPASSCSGFEACSDPSFLQSCYALRNARRRECGRLPAESQSFTGSMSQKLRKSCGACSRTFSNVETMLISEIIFCVLVKDFQLRSKRVSGPLIKVRSGLYFREADRSPSAFTLVGVVESARQQRLVQLSYGR